MLKISSGIWSASCDLVVVDYNSTIPKYEAISWRWGRDDKTHSLHLGASVHHINTKVFEILSELVPNFGSRYVWLDYICINQNDRSDKANQIPMMTEIYRGATRVVACVGDGEGSHLVPDFLAELDAHLFQYVRDDWFPKMDRSDHFPFRDQEENWRALLTLIQKDIWSRAWIIQGQLINCFLVHGKPHADC